MVVRSDGAIPRFERMQRYLAVPDLEESPNFSSRENTEYFLRCIRKPGQRDDALKRVVSCLAYLLADQQLQYAGAATREDYWEYGLEKSIGLFEQFSDKPKSFDFFWGCDYLSVAWIFAFLNDDEEAFVKLCETLKPNFASEKRWDRGDTPVEVAQVQLVIAQSFRSKAIRGAKAFPESISNGKSVRGKSTLKVWQAIEEKDSAAFANHFKKLLNATISANQKKIDRRNGSFTFNFG